MNKNIKRELCEVFENEITTYIFFNKNIYERLTKRYLKKNKIQYPLGHTFDDYIKTIDNIETNFDILSWDLIEIFIEDNVICDPFLIYLYNVYIDKDNIDIGMIEAIRNRKHFDEE